MSELLGADTRRVDVIAEELGECCQNIQDLRTTAGRAMAELREAWAGPAFEGIFQRWEQEVGPRLAEMSAGLSTMASVLRSEAEAQRRASNSLQGSSASVRRDGTPGGEWKFDGLPPSCDVDAKLLTVSEREYNRGEKQARHGKLAAFETMTIGTTSGNRTDTSRSSFFNSHQVATGEDVVWGPNGQQVNQSTAADHVKLNLVEGDVTLVDESLASLKGGSDGSGYELSAGKVEAEADYSVDVNAKGNAVASVGVSTAAYAGYAAGALHLGNDFAKGKVEGRVYAGAEVKADALGSIGSSGARGHFGAEAFAGVMAEANGGVTLAGVTAAAGAEISFGIGAHAEVDGEFSATAVGFSVDIGAALGIGTGFAAEVSVSPQEAIANVGHVSDAIGEGLTLVGGGVVSFVDW